MPGLPRPPAEPLRSERADHGTDPEVTPVPIKAVVWDVDDTLFDYTAADRAGMRVHRAAEGLLGGYGTVEQALAQWREITDRQWARYAAGETSFEGQRRDRVRVFLGEELTDDEADA